MLIGFQIIHHMNTKRHGDMCEMATKINITKAYGRISWGYLNVTMQLLGSENRWINWIMLCLSSVKYSIVVNGDLVGPFSPKRGLRQEEPSTPISLYHLFIGPLILIEAS